MLKRRKILQIDRDLSSFPVVAILGPRQVGKTTIAKELISQWTDALYLDLEKPSDLNKLNSAESYLNLHRDKTVCIDEVQLRPDLFPLIRSLVDEHRKNARFLILGSSSPDLLRQSSETLAGRISYNYLTPFDESEMPEKSWQKGLWRGGFPDSYLASSDEVSIRWRENYIQTFLQRDLRQFGLQQSPEKMRRMWIMCAHSAGQIINFSKLGQSLDLTHPTVITYIDNLQSTFMVRKLLPYEINTKKRLVKSPKLFIRDSGLMCSLLDIPSIDHLFGHPSFGNCWEGHAIENILNILEPKGMYGFFRTHSGDEIDLVLELDGKRIGFEFKTSSAPSLDKGNYKAKALLELDKLVIITPEADSYQLEEGVEVTSLRKFLANYCKHTS